jgi:DNA-binding response OmpR family regulator
MRLPLVEDNPDDALIVEDRLSRTGVEIEHASNLSLALEKLARDDFEWVLADFSLRGGRGEKLRLRTTKATAPRFHFRCRPSRMHRKTNVSINAEAAFGPYVS